MSFTLPFYSEVSLTLFDLTGRTVQTLINEPLPAGAHRVNMNAAPLSSGSYFARVATAQFSATTKLVLLK